ncbi:hypothetical protein QJQ45_012976 [Haematococcus lacustris]|nr:hypothetical protein QJQ45_012976 [Haematococcus lacustris]
MPTASKGLYGLDAHQPLPSVQLARHAAPRTNEAVKPFRLQLSPCGRRREWGHGRTTRLRSSWPLTSRGRAYAVFGHSMGAWIAYEVVQELQRTGHALPLHLFVASNRAPSLCGASHDVDSTRLSQLTELEFWAALERRYGANPALASPALRKAMWPVLKADFTLLETYQHDPGTPAVPCPLTVIAGSLDTRFTKDQVAAWQHHALAPGSLFGAEFQEVWLEGQGHNFISQPPAQLVQLLRDALQ